MATSADAAPSTRPRPLQIGWLLAFARGVERWLEAERDQLVLWLPVMLGGGIALWMLLPDPPAWRAAALAGAGIALTAVAIGRGDRAGRAVAVAAALVAAGVVLIWIRADMVGVMPIAGPVLARFDARVERVEPLAARDLVRLRLAPLRVIADGKHAPPALPGRLRINLATADVPVGLSEGATIRLRARLMPPPGPAVPGGYDFARVAWFDGIGATGRGLAPVTLLTRGASGFGLGALRAALSRHIQQSAPGGPGAVAAALATGDQYAISESDADAMRRSGLAHLLSVSGLHITAAVGAVMLIVGRLLALSPWVALRWRVPMIAAGAGAMAAIAYTLLTGAEVPTVRSCVAALLVLVALAMGREAITLRLVAAGAFVVLMLFPEAVAGPSFQLSFAAVAAIVSLHEHPSMKRAFGPHEEGRGRATLRGLVSLLLTGIVVELALIPISVFHFHRAGVYGSVANIVAIPLTTFVTMPFEALALLFDPVGLGWPFWWVTARSLDLLLWIAHSVAALPGAVASIPAMPSGAYALMAGGGLWIALWRTRWRRLGAAPLAIGAVWALLTPTPDLLVTGDGRHAAIRTAGGNLAVLRDRTGDYTANTFAENGGIVGVPLLLSEQPDARCSRDLCLVQRTSRGRRWRVLATRSGYLVPTEHLTPLCKSVDIVISERRLPRTCVPRWLKLDQTTLAKTGGAAITLSNRSLTTVNQPGDRHPWRINRSVAKSRRAYPGYVPARGRSAADHKSGWRDRAEPSHPRDGST
jgi:competence protein ComEC